MKRQLTTFAFAGFLGLCCIGCPPADQEPVDTDVDTELNETDIDAGTVPAEGDSNTTTAAEGETAGIEMPTEEEAAPEEEAVTEEEVVTEEETPQE